MSKTERIWLGFGIVALLGNIAVPFGLVKEWGCFSGAFLFWCSTALLVIGAGVYVMSRWGEGGRFPCR